MSALPSFAETIPFWTKHGFTKRESVRHILDYRNAAHNAHGKGNRAMRRLRAKARVHELPLAQVRE